MSELNTKIKDDIKEAMRNKEVLKRDTLRTLTAAIKQYEVDTRETITDAVVETLIQRLIKQRDEAARQYKDAGRDDLYEKESGEIEILKAYLPKQLDDVELEAVVRALVAEVGAEGPKDMGKVMGATKEKIGTKADGKRVSECVKAVLASL
jgi:hypothetical protein